MSDSSLKDIPDKISSLTELLCHRADRQPDRTAHIFLKQGESEETRMSYQDLDKHARSIASRLRALKGTGERALLLYPPGPEYIAAFFGCLYAGVIAVPLYPPPSARPERALLRLRAVIKNARPFAALTMGPLLSSVRPMFSQYPEFENMHWITNSGISDDLSSDWQEPALNRDSPAFLQYTSGSTGTPKGVIVSHGNLLHNSAFIQERLGHSSESLGVIWLPPYHDMGLIGGVIQPLYSGFPAVMMSPVAFLQKPLRWLSAISRYKGTSSGGPNFAYELCVRRISPEQKEELDLSTWKLAFNGAEPVRGETLDRFSKAFASCGFRRSAFYPCYGLAEATLMASGGRKESPPVLQKSPSHGQVSPFMKSGKKSGKTTMVGCGSSADDQQLLIVNTETLKACSPGEVGEIWVCGKSVAQGYWEQPAETEQTFGAFLADTGEGPFLRTGDLGFLENGELFVTGRIKDLIIIRGRNHYPQDIEMTAESAHPALREGCSAAFGADAEGEERLFVVAEIRRKDLRGFGKPGNTLQSGTSEVFLDHKTEAIANSIRRTVAEQHELQVYGVVLLRPGSIPKTSSGKIQRYACREEFLHETLNTVGVSILPANPDTGRDDSDGVSPDREQFAGAGPEKQRVMLESYLQDMISGSFESVLRGRKVGIRDNFFG